MSWETTASTPADGWKTGVSLLSAGKPQEAVDVLQPFVEAHPHSFEGNNYLGVALAQNGRTDEAIAALQQAAWLNPQSAQPHYNLGMAHEAAGSREKARLEYDSALKLDPKYTAAAHALTRLDTAPAAAAPETMGWQIQHASTAPAAARQLEEQERASRLTAANVFTGFLAGFVVAVVCAVLWDKLTYYTGWQFGYAAIGVGFAVGTAVVWGARSKHGFSLQVVGALLALFGILLGETFLIMEYVRDGIAAEPSAANAGATGLDIFVYSVTLLPESFQASPMSALFAAIGLWFGWSTPASQPEEIYPEATATDADPAPDATLPTEAPSPNTWDAPPRP